MSNTLTRIRELVAARQILVSVHAYDEMAVDDILFEEILTGVASGVAIEDYEEAQRGPSVLVLQADADGRPIHVVWGIPKTKTGPAVIVTAYRPDPARWSEDFGKRKK